MADLPPDMQAALAKIPPGDPLREAIERAALAGLSPEALAEAERQKQLREEQERRERVTQLSRLADAALGGAYGKAAAAAVSATLAGGKSPEALERVARIVSEAKEQRAKGKRP